MMAILKSAIDIVHRHIYLESDTSGAKSKWSESCPSRARNIDRDLTGAYEMIVCQYFSGEESLYSKGYFERIFGSYRCVILRLYNNVHDHSPFL